MSGQLSINNDELTPFKIESQVIHHFFLTRYGVYCVVFNMEWLVGGDDETKDRCLATLKFWICSIVVHTYDHETKETAPLVLVGTRKDKVNNPADHHRISTILYDNFSSSLAWPSVVENDNGSGANGRVCLFFFPVDNVRGRSDPQVQHLLQDVEKVIDESDYVHKEQPLVYLQTLDKLSALNRSCFSYDEVSEVAQLCGVDANGVTTMLSLFHEMGILMFHGMYVDIMYVDILLISSMNQ